MTDMQTSRPSTSPDQEQEPTAKRAPVSIHPRRSKFNLACMLAPSIICLVVLITLTVVMSSCSTSDEQAQPTIIQVQPKDTAFKLEPGKKVLVLPFTCNILPEEYQAAASLVQRAHTGWTVFALQSAGVHADDYYSVFGKVPPSPAPGAYLPITPGSQVSKDATGKIVITQTHEENLTDGSYSAEMSAGQPVEQGADDGVVEEGTEMLAAPAESGGPVVDAGVPVADEAAAVADGSASLGTDPGIITVERSRSMLEEALEMSEYDYVMTGNIVFLHTEVKPATRAGGKAATTVRGEFSSAYRLLETGNGKILASGAATGKAGKYISLGSGYEPVYILFNAMSRVMNQSIQSSAQHSVGRLLDPGYGRQAAGDDGHGVDSDREYYQDSPGKRLKPAN